jgi:transcriptional regulator with XRE-family HTH domain
MNNDKLYNGEKHFPATGRIRAYAEFYGLTLKEACRRSGISDSTIRNSERKGSQLSLSLVEGFCNSMDIPLWVFCYPALVNPQRAILLTPLITALLTGPDLSLPAQQALIRELDKLLLLEKEAS